MERGTGVTAEMARRLMSSLHSYRVRSIEWLDECSHCNSWI